MYRVKYSLLSLRQLRRITMYQRRRIMNAIDDLGESDPRSRSTVKEIRGIKPPWEGRSPFFQLRVGEYRVFFDIDDDDAVLLVNAIRHKGRKTTKETL